MHSDERIFGAKCMSPMKLTHSLTPDAVCISRGDAVEVAKSAIRTELLGLELAFCLQAIVCAWAGSIR